ncbi:MAG TPA: adenylate/guanylate cyclase domain-containing protein [Burkholderiales bacterium]|nr:adenylate/guanylate cyclase domain-containing protein [Burkholderiales bacterium]
MAAPLTGLQRERVRLYFRLVAASALIGGLYGVVQGQPAQAPGFNVLVGLVDGPLIAGSIAGIEIFLLRESGAARRLLGLPFAAVVALKTLVYALIVAAVSAGGVRALALPYSGRVRVGPFDFAGELGNISFALSMTLIFVVVLQAAALIGRRTFRDLVLGRYRRPRAERRFFLFVDVIGSTAIAERLGPLKAHEFLAAVFSATAEPVAAWRGEIYQYVGDEIVVTWTEEEGRPGARPLRCCFEMQAALEAAAPDFRARFGAEPRLRAALHLGEVIAGEVGQQRRAIVYHGDVMNTAARLEQATREAGVRFIVSDDALRALAPPRDIATRDLGALALRGRSGAIRAWAVEQP